MKNYTRGKYLGNPQHCDTPELYIYVNEDEITGIRALKAYINGVLVSDETNSPLDLAIAINSSTPLNRKYNVSLIMESSKLDIVRLAKVALGDNK
tara:strand:+ start:440 stop:724 length:285 start_codon:yes stop_codon:yes gene_type:complete